MEFGVWGFGFGNCGFRVGSWSFQCTNSQRDAQRIQEGRCAPLLGALGTTNPHKWTKRLTVALRFFRRKRRNLPVVRGSDGRREKGREGKRVGTVWHLPFRRILPALSIQVQEYRSTSLIRNSPPPYDHRRALVIVVLYGYKFIIILTIINIYFITFTCQP